MACEPVRRDKPGIIDFTCAQTMLYLTCTMISSVDLASHGNWVYVDCGTIIVFVHFLSKDENALLPFCHQHQ